MKILFKYKHWIIIQSIYVIVGVLTVFILKASGKIVEGQIASGLAISMHFISNTQELLIPILMLMLADLAFNIEYVEGTFLTHLLCGKSRIRWMLNRLCNFYLFITLQFFIAFVLITVGAGIIMGSFTLGAMEVNANIGIIEIISPIIINILKTLVFTSFAILVTTFLPGKLMIGSIISVGIIFVTIKITNILMILFQENKILKIIVDMIWLTESKEAFIYGIIWIVLFTYLSIRRVDKIVITNQGS
ncbi:hypothetical protein X275_08565 [Marinitoga sp. 1197]|uniref:hypothetical protein n=1 Tax=unclassified Marinitoga TaxID=2640159 RepID=UPI000659EDBE|nr:MULTISPECIES: hypothetical protein [unclassified Marinitoga]KLO21338.1 hypothetical protein X274_10735 [Marinitoga sp. 1155]KLO21582.1 hypothetical protein X275_08565 [Marinitoga sp. 1197]